MTPKILAIVMLNPETGAVSVVDGQARVQEAAVEYFERAPVLRARATEENVQASPKAEALPDAGDNPGDPQPRSSLPKGYAKRLENELG